MLPWKRHKFELLATDEEGPQQPQRPGLAAPLPCSAALGSLARACPAESALSRMGSLFRSKRKKFRVSSEAPTYTALYLGNATTLQAKGEGCTDVAVAKIWAKSEAGRHGTKMKLTIGPQGIRLAPAVPAEAASRPGHLYLLHRVTYCVADPRLPRLFAWIYRHEVKHKAVLLRCHAVLVSKAEKARAMALLLYQTSAAALAEFRRLKKRADARHQQLQQVGPGADGAIPLVPLRKLLLHGPGGCYKPPVERSRSAPKLGSITEDSLGEELEERAAGPACANGAQDEECDGAQDEEDELLAPLGQLICGLGELAIGNDVALLRADLRVTRLLSGESTGSESSIESNGHEGGGGGGGGGGGTGGSSPPPPLRSCHSPEPDCG
ncbi:PREDICTED: protein FAM43A [Thamnophis sirtalis]|uniref:Protein FAM43A n=1 Tax=Thamnophis sirtalis TaxID=35019 RepID=A0A6I9Z4H0_9SAUR|nr:PREDICTED: protein FAM43A [Thamnophis sirtalis]